jgi:hydroxymethylpyrimidine kinase/phosphomethylpyrimidine kinase
MLPPAQGFVKDPARSTFGSPAGPARSIGRLQRPAGAGILSAMRHDEGFRPVALTVAGSDSGGGAGIQADLKVFAALGVHGTSAITCLTAQTPAGVAGVHAVPAAFVHRQLDTLGRDLPPAAAKTGMLFNAGIIRAVADAMGRGPKFPWVVDPVMIATSGARLLRPDAMRALQDRLLPLAALVTPNLDEAAVLMGRPLRSIDDLRWAARGIHGRWGVPALVKGGHLRVVPEATDIFWDGREERILRAPFVPGVSTHGTGCTYSAAITASLALGHPMPEAVERAKRAITRAIRRSTRLGPEGRFEALQPG